MSTLIHQLNQERHKLSSLGSVLMVAGVVYMAQFVQEPAQQLAQEAMELTTTLIEPLFQPPPPPQARAPEPQPKLKAITPAPVEPVKELTATEPVRAAPQAAPSQAAPPTPAPPLATAAPTVTPPSPQEVPKAAPQVPVSVSLENTYVSSVRTLLNANKRYPTGREASLQRPSGKVKVWFVLLRNGTLQDAGIDDSSNSIILDNAALATVRRTTYAPWPDGTWATQAQHKFTVTLDFVPLN
jgi:protein TonB